MGEGVKVTQGMDANNLQLFPLLKSNLVKTLRLHRFPINLALGQSWFPLFRMIKVVVYCAIIWHLSVEACHVQINPVKEYFPLQPLRFQIL